jgi:hypothetical protein
VNVNRAALVNMACRSQFTFSLEPIIEVMAWFAAAGLINFVGAIPDRIDAHFSRCAGSIVGNRRAEDFPPLAPFSGHGYFPLWLLLALRTSRSA